MVKREDSNKLVSDFERLLDSSTLTDVKIKCEGKILECHKSILSARCLPLLVWGMLTIQLSAIRSSVFRAMFQHDMRESKSNEIIIPDLDFNTVKDMVRYVYSGRWISLLRVLTWVLFNFNQGEWSFRQVRPTSQCCWQIWHQVRNVSKEAFINWQLKLSIVILTRDLKEECCQSLSANLAVDQVISGWQLCIFFVAKHAS